MKQRLIITFLFITGIIAMSLYQTPAYGQEEEDEKPAIPLDHFYAKPKNRTGLRTLLSKFTFGLSTGYGRTFYKQDLSDFGLLQRQGEDSPILFGKDFNTSGGTISSGYTYWFNDAVSTDSIVFDPANDFIVSNDTADIKYKAGGFSIPLNASIHFEFDRYKVGAGFTFEFHSPGNFKPNSFKDDLGEFKPNFGSAFFKRYYAILGAKVYRYYDYLLSVDANIGSINLTNKFNKSLIQKGIYVNIGATIEKELSEYSSVFMRPSYDFKNYTLNLPESGLAVNHSMNAFYISFGIFYRIPDMPKCFHKQCKTQINHQHGNMVYRSRVHPFYKKQNPHHGENYPVLIKYKRKNKKKLHAY